MTVYAEEEAGETNEIESVMFDEVFDEEEVAQEVKLRLDTVRGEDPWRVDAGFPLRDVIGPFNRSLLKNVIASEIRKVSRVERVENVGVELVDRANRIARIRPSFIVSGRGVSFDIGVVI